MKCFLFHSWGEWSQSFEVPYIKYFPFSGKEIEGVDILQERKCKKCGEIQRRIVI